MPIPPEIAHHLRSLVELSLLGPDAEWYFAFVATDTVAVVDGFDRLPPRPKTGYFGREADFAEYLEAVYLRWRAANPQVAPGVSYATYDDASILIEKIVNHITGELLERGHQTLTPAAMSVIRHCTAYPQVRHPLRRACGRLRADTLGYDEERRKANLELCNVLFEDFQTSDVEVMAAARRALGADWEDSGVAHQDPKRMRIELKRGIRADRQKVKRSVRAAEQFLGPETVRMFVGGAHIRISGERAIYEITKASRMLESHGSTTFSILDPETKDKLCDLCVYTPGVPMLDHVLGLIFRIRAGCEDEILETGNPYNISEAARSVPWLAPHLDRLSPRDPGPPVQEDAEDRYMSVEEVKRRLVIMNLRKEVATFVFEDFGDLLPEIPYTRNALTCGLTPAEYITQEYMDRQREEYQRIDNDLTAIFAQVDQRKPPPMIIDI